jgi:hypothetical protein
LLLGIGGAHGQPLLPSVPPLFAFPLLFAGSALAAIAGSLATAAPDPSTLEAFYRRTRPWGAWGPVLRRVVYADATFLPNHDGGRDLVNIVVGIVWQTALVALPIYVVIKDVRGALASIAVVALATLFLKRFWFDRLEEE